MLSTKTKIDSKKTAEAAKDQLKNNAVTKSASDIFAKIKAKAPSIDNKKVDAWQKAWLAMPENRKKYEHLQDAPKVVGEELIAMTNDIVDFVQREGGGNSHLFQKIKDGIKKFDFHKLLDKAKASIGQIKGKAMDAKNMAIEKAKDAKSVADKAKDVAKKVKK